MGNADETLVFIDMPPQLMLKVEPFGGKTSTYKRFWTTVMPSEALLFLKRKKPHKKNTSGGIIYKCNEEGSMTEVFMIQWLKEV